jgi:tyrosyl-tRNA synthetase
MNNPLMHDTSTILDHLGRTTDRIVGLDDLVARLDNGTPLRIKFGVDCTAPDLHIGHAVNLWMMRHLQDLGHAVVFLLGDVTTRIGDPTGRSQTRPMLPPEQIDANAARYLDQVSLVLRTDPAVLEIRRNSEWYAAMDVADLIGVFMHITHAQLTARDMFRDRITAGREIGLHELIYPVLQAYDSVAVQSDLTIVGSDQLFNEALGRQLQQRLGSRPQTVITSRITPGLDGGPKQSKSLGNYVALTDPPDEKFGKLMSLPDELVGEYALVYTELPMTDVRRLGGAAAGGGGAGARDAKLAMAEAVVARYHGTVAATESRSSFLRVFSDRSDPDEMSSLLVGERLSALALVRAARPDASNSTIRRLIEQGAVSLGGIRLGDPAGVVSVRTGDVLRIGRRSWHRLHVVRGG